MNFGLRNRKRIVCANLLAGVLVLAATTALCASSNASEPTRGSNHHARALTRPQVRAACRGIPREAARWAPLVNRSLAFWHRRYHLSYGTNDLRRALLIMWRESRGNPRAVNPSSGAAGLFQWLPSWWRSKGYPIFDPRWNTGMMSSYHASHEAIGSDEWAPWAL